MFRRKVAYDEAAVIAGIRRSGTERRRAENTLFDRFAYLVAKGKQQHNLTEEEALDAYAEAILALVQQIAGGTFQEDKRISTLLHQVFYYKCVDVFRRRTNTRIEVDPEELGLSAIPDPAQDVVKAIVEREEVGRLAALLGHLGDSCRDILWDSLYHGYRPAEIAEKMGLKNAETVMSQKSRCLKKLKGLLAHDQI